MNAAAPASAFDGWCSEPARNVGASDVNRPNAAKPTPAPSAAPKYSPPRGGRDGHALRAVGRAGSTRASRVSGVAATSAIAASRPPRPTTYGTVSGLVDPLRQHAGDQRA